MQGGRGAGTVNPRVCECVLDRRVWSRRSSSSSSSQCVPSSPLIKLPLLFPPCFLFNLGWHVPSNCHPLPLRLPPCP